MLNTAESKRTRGRSQSSKYIQSFKVEISLVRTTVKENGRTGLREEDG